MTLLIKPKDLTVTDFAMVATPIGRLNDLIWSLAKVSKNLNLEHIDGTEDYYKAKTLIQLNSWYRGDLVLIEQVTLLFLYWNAKCSDLEMFNEEVKRYQSHLGTMRRRFLLQMENLYLQFNR